MRADHMSGSVEYELEPRCDSRAPSRYRYEWCEFEVRRQVPRKSRAICSRERARTLWLTPLRPADCLPRSLPMTNRSTVPIILAHDAATGFTLELIGPAGHRQILVRDRIAGGSAAPVELAAFAGWLLCAPGWTDALCRWDTPAVKIVRAMLRHLEPASSPTCWGTRTRPCSERRYSWSCRRADAGRDLARS